MPCICLSDASYSAWHKDPNLLPDSAYWSSTLHMADRSWCITPRLRPSTFSQSAKGGRQQFSFLSVCFPFSGYLTLHILVLVCFGFRMLSSFELAWKKILGLFTLTPVLSNSVMYLLCFIAQKLNGIQLFNLKVHSQTLRVRTLLHSFAGGCP